MANPAPSIDVPSIVGRATPLRELDWVPWERLRHADGVGVAALTRLAFRESHGHLEAAAARHPDLAPFRRPFAPLIAEPLESTSGDAIESFVAELYEDTSDPPTDAS